MPLHKEKSVSRGKLGNRVKFFFKVQPYTFMDQSSIMEICAELALSERMKRRDKVSKGARRTRDQSSHVHGGGRGPAKHGGAQRGRKQSRAQPEGTARATRVSRTPREEQNKALENQLFHARSECGRPRLPGLLAGSQASPVLNSPTSRRWVVFCFCKAVTDDSC